jgi:hypothetical protein
LESSVTSNHQKFFIKSRFTFDETTTFEVEVISKPDGWEME